MKNTLLILTLLLCLLLPSVGCTSSANSTDYQSVATPDIAKLTNKGTLAEEFCRSKKYNTDYCFLADMSMHSGLKRLFLWNFKNDTIEKSFLLGHGCGQSYWSYDFSKSNPTFSNVANSHCSSLGKYKIGERGYSNWGIHIKYLLYGLDASNSNALSRQIVFHSWDEMSDAEVYPDGSPEGWGCPTVSNTAMKEIDEKLQATQKPLLLWMFD